MSPCPKCGVTAKHVGVVVGWRPSDPWSILHDCKTCGSFTDPVLFPGPILARVRASAFSYEAKNRPWSQADCAVLDKAGLKWMVDGEPETNYEADEEFPRNIEGWLKSVGNVKLHYDRDAEEWRYEPEPPGPANSLFVFSEDDAEWMPFHDLADDGTEEVWQLQTPEQVASILGAFSNQADRKVP